MITIVGCESQTTL